MKWFKSLKEGTGTPADNIKVCYIISAFLRRRNEIFVLLGLLGPWRWERWFVPKRLELTSNLRCVTSQHREDTESLFLSFLGNTVGYKFKVPMLSSHSQTVPITPNVILPEGYSVMCTSLNQRLPISLYDVLYASQRSSANAVEYTRN